MSLDTVCIVLAVLAVGMVEVLRTRALKRLTAAQSQLHAVLSASAEAVFWMDRKGKIKDCNYAATQMFGRTIDELVGHYIFSVIPSLTLEAPKLKTADCLHRKSILKMPERTNTFGMDRDYNRFPVSLVIKRAGNASASRYVVLVRDDTVRDLAQQELERYADQLLMTKQSLERHNVRLEATVKSRTNDLRRALESAKSANTAKSEFLANVSHELRTPLHGILSFAGFGRRRIDRCTKEKLRYYFENIEHCGTTLLHLVNQLLDLAKLESGKTELDKREWDMAAIVGDVVAELKALAEEKGVNIRVDGGVHAASLIVDRERIAQVIRNLLSNALKVSPSGGSVSVELNQSSESFAIRVVDQGPGIPEEELDLIFDKFEQSSRTNSGAGGTGLGLAICREIVLHHQGRIWAENVAPHGAALCFDVPLQLLPSTSVEEDSEQASASSIDDGYPVVPFKVTAAAERVPCLQQTAS